VWTGQQQPGRVDAEEFDSPVHEQVQEAIMPVAWCTCGLNAQPATLR
jgi:hypothetical protein